MYSRTNGWLSNVWDEVVDRSKAALDDVLNNVQNGDVSSLSGLAVSAATAAIKGKK